MLGGASAHKLKEEELSESKIAEWAVVAFHSVQLDDTQSSAAGKAEDNEGTMNVVLDFLLFDCAWLWQGLHLTLGQDWGIGRYTRYQCHI